MSASIRFSRVTILAIGARHWRTFAEFVDNSADQACTASKRLILAGIVGLAMVRPPGSRFFP